MRTSEDNARAQSEPRQEAEAACGPKPGGSEIASDERREGESEGRRKTREADIQHDGVNHHDWVLKEWVEPLPI